MDALVKTAAVDIGSSISSRNLPTSRRCSFELYREAADVR